MSTEEPNGTSAVNFHTFGDSHCRMPWSQIPAVTVHHLGASLCHSFGRDGRARLDIRNFGVRAGDVVCFCFGEIDCRCHVKNHCSSELSYKSVIDDIVSRYMNAIKENTEHYKQPKLTVCVYNVVPPPRRHHATENLDFPFVGSDEERVAFVMYFNTCLSEACARHGFTFFNIYSRYCDGEGFLLEEASDGHVHIVDATHVEKRFHEIIDSAHVCNLGQR
jgi:hypothetical protein